jgi:hypothetical protein
MAARADGTFGTSPGPMNLWDLGAAADPLPAAATTTCPCSASSCVTTGESGRGYGAEVRFELGLLGPDPYRYVISREVWAISLDEGAWLSVSESHIHPEIPLLAAP